MINRIIMNSFINRKKILGTCIQYSVLLKNMINRSFLLDDTSIYIIRKVLGDICWLLFHRLFYKRNDSTKLNSCSQLVELLS